MLTLKSNETELLDESRGNCVSGNFCNAIPSSELEIFIARETHFSENHPGVVSTSSSLPQSSPWRQLACFIIRILMAIVSMIFLERMSLNSERMSNRGSSLSSLTQIFTEMCFKVCIDGRSISLRLGLTFCGSRTGME